MAITHYQPWGLLNQLQREWERAQDIDSADGSVATSEWTPAVDIKEQSDHFVIHADIPGVKPEDIDISMEDGVITIKGEKQTEATTDKDGFKRVERSYGTFYRRFSLPDTADSEAISAKSAHGVLVITIPKREAVKPKKITVDIAE